MDYKKKYEEAVNKLEKFFINNDDRILYKHDIESVFPELKKSEDDIIRRAIKEAVEYYWSDDTQARTNIIAWLKKQCEQKSVEWSENDEKYYNSALWHIKNSCGIEGNIYNWLKSIKERIKRNVY